MMEIINNPEESLGDIRVRYYTHKFAVGNDHSKRQMVSILGRQKNNSIESEDSSFLMKFG